MFLHIVHTLALTEGLADKQCAALMVLSVKAIVYPKCDVYNSPSSIQRLFVFDSVAQRKRLVWTDKNGMFGFSPTLLSLPFTTVNIT